MRYPTIGKVGSERGAPMGRGAWGATPANGSVRVFLVPLDSGGYDPGGAYWGHANDGTSLYCATDGKDYRDFARAASREEAIAKMKIDAAKLKRRTTRKETL